VFSPRSATIWRGADALRECENRRDIDPRAEGKAFRGYHQIAAKPRGDTYVTFDEYSWENWGVGEKLLDEIKGLRK
jgi:hypothetical protein